MKPVVCSFQPVRVMSKPAKRTHSRHPGANPWTLPANLCRPGSRTKYAFDDIGNRDQTVINGGTTDYTANLLNQYTAVGAASPAHDTDGNLTGDGTWTYTWDGENRLTAMEKSNQRLEFTYDWQGRRVQKKVFSGSTGNWSLTLERRFVYDGWNLLTIMDGNAALKQQFMWGTDLSGTPQGAGGVGGLVKIYDHSLNKHFFPGYDGNGNVMLLVDGDTGAAAARYEYGPFGELLSATGSYATANPFRFSTKFTDDETGMLYYGYRYYLPAWGRWASRDPIGEAVGPSLYGFIVNAPPASYDMLGLFGCTRDPCASPCEDAQRKDPPLDRARGQKDPDAGGIICCNGKAFVCVWDDTGPGKTSVKKTRALIKKCIEKHEKVHLPDVVCPAAPDFSRGEGPASKVEQSECNAYWAELACLKKAAFECDGSALCLMEIMSTIRDVKLQIDRYCNQ